MIERYVHKKITWLDVINPTTEEVRDLIEECGIPNEFAHDLTTITHRTETFAKKGVLKLTLPFPVVKRTDLNHPHEIKFIVTKTHFVTVHFENIQAIHEFSKQFEIFSVLKQTKATVKTDSLRIFFVLFAHLYTTMNTKLDYLESRLRTIEQEIFNYREKEMVFELSVVSRRLIDFRQVVGAHEKALEQLIIEVPIAFTSKQGVFITDLEHQYRHVYRRTLALISTTEDLRDTNIALLSTKQNEVMKMFTILAFITFPLTLFSSMFGMNTVTTPIIGRPGDFWIILTIMAVVSICFFAYFKYRRWF